MIVPLRWIQYDQTVRLRYILFAFIVCSVVVFSSSSPGLVYLQLIKSKLSDKKVISSRPLLLSKGHMGFGHPFAIPLLRLLKMAKAEDRIIKPGLQAEKTRWIQYSQTLRHRYIIFVFMLILFFFRQQSSLSISSA